MSQIFDALQRAENERAGSGIADPAKITEVLERAERLTSQEWEKDHKDRSESRNGNEHRNGVESNGHPFVAGGRDVAPVSIPREAQQFETVETHLPADSRLVCVTQQETPSAEAFRLLCVRLRDMRRERALKRLLITSTIPQEGKSTVAANLACALAQTGKEKVLLLEGDVRRPSQSKIFGLGLRTGMCSWLQGDQELSKCIYRIETPGLWMLPAGTASRNPIELLQPSKVSTLMSTLDDWFDIIVIDSPPVLPLADTSMWVRLADGILLVTREGVTEKKQLTRGLEALEGQKLIGALANCSTEPANSYYY